MKYLLAIGLIVLASCNTGNQLPTPHEFSISNKGFTGKVVFEKLSSTTGFKVLLKTDSGEILDQTVFKYAPYRFDTLDVNHDGRTEIIVGLTKATRFDPTEKKRLFILQIDDNQVRPLWLGSKVCQELVDFKVLKDGTIQTLEQTKTGTFAIGLYYWQSFGLTLEKYTYNEINYDYAYQVFQH